MIKRQILLFLYSFLGITLFTFAQSNSPIRNIYAVYVVHIPGNIPVDRNGNAISTFDTSTIIYVESTPTVIQWVKVWKNNKSYSILSTPIANSYLDIGTKNTSNEKMIIRVSKENKLWQLQLSPDEKNTSIPSRIKLAPGEILLQTIYRGKKNFKRITYQTELRSIPSV